MSHFVKANRFMHLTRCVKTLVLLLLVGLGSSALAHATLVLGTLQSVPGVPQPDEPISLVLELADPTGVPVEDAWVLAEFRPEGAPEGEPLGVRFEESAPGRYGAEITLPAAGDWQLLLRDQTFRQEEARATLSFPVGTAAVGDALSFVFPPTATGPRGLATWLVWVIVLPIVAGIVVTVVVLRGSREEVETA